MEPMNLNFEQMKTIDIQTVDRGTLVDIQDVKIDSKLPCEERLADYIRQIKNPYCYRCGKIIVKTSFASTDITLNDRLEHYIKSL